MNVYVYWYRATITNERSMFKTRSSGVELLLVSSESPEQSVTLLENEPSFSLRTATVPRVPSGQLADVDCIVCIHGGSVDGVELLERVRDRRPGLPFVLVAEADEGALVSRAVASGVSEFVSLGNVGDRLVPRVEAAVHGQRSSGFDGSSGIGGPSDADEPSDVEGSSGVDEADPMRIDSMPADRELRLKERAMDEAPVGITITDPSRPDNPMIYVNDAFERLTGYPKEDAVRRNCRFLQGAESDPAVVDTMRKAVEQGEPTAVEVLNYRKSGDPFWNQVTIAPITDADGTVTNFVGFQQDVTERKKAELAAKRERANLEHLLDRIGGLVQEVTHELVEAERRSDVEAAVCERIAAIDTYEFAWLATPNRPQEALTASATAGAWTQPEDALEADLIDPDVHETTVEAFKTDTVRTVDDPAAIARVVANFPWIPTSTCGMAAIPISYGDTTYGVLTVYTDDEATLSEHELTVLTALGRSTATAINALERGRLIATDSVTELTIRTRSESLFFVAVSEETGCSLTYDGAVYEDEGSVLLFFRTDTEAADVLEAAESHPQVDAAQELAAYGGESLLEFRLPETSIATTLGERGARIQSITVENREAEVEFVIPSETGARTVVDLLEERYGHVEVLAQRDRERPPATRREFVTDVEERLTDRQLTAIRKAHVSDYFQWNRPVTGDSLADSMDIGRSTYHQHLRAAERKLIESFFDR